MNNKELFRGNYKGIEFIVEEGDKIKLSLSGKLRGEKQEVEFNKLYELFYYLGELYYKVEKRRDE